MPQPQTSILQAQPQTRAILASYAVFDAQQHRRFRAPRRNLQPAALPAARDSMNDGILNHRLQHHLRHQQLTRVGLNVPTNVESFCEPHLFDIQVVLSELQLFFERDEIGVRFLKGGAEQSRESKNHRFGSRSIAIDQCGDSLEGVEQEMRMELALQRLKFACRKLSLQFRTLEFLVSNPREIPIGVGGNDRYKVVPQLIAEQISVGEQTLEGPRAELLRQNVVGRQNDPSREYGNNQEGYAAQNVPADAPEECLLVDRIPTDD